jgi:hypothetical protein
VWGGDAAQSVAALGRAGWARVAAAAYNHATMPRIAWKALIWRRASGDGAAAGAEAEEQVAAHVLHCRWGCGKAVHRACAANYERNACVYCGVAMQ